MPPGSSFQCSPVGRPSRSTMRARAKQADASGYASSAASCLPSLSRRQASSAAAFERVGDRKILVFTGRQEVPTIDPSVKYDWSIRMMQQALYDALVKYVGNPPEIVPWLAEKWEVSSDAKTWTFHLARNARFHNGDPVTAEAVRWSFARSRHLAAALLVN